MRTSALQPTGSALPHGFLRRRFTRTIITATVAAAAVAGVSALPAASPDEAAHTAAAQIQPVELHLSADEQAQWQREIGTAAGRGHVLEALQAAFGSVATVGVGPTVTPPQTGETGVRNVSYDTGLPLRPEWAAGITGDHFWITASYADIASGAIWAAVRVCQTRLPSWLCTSAGNLLVSWAQGWGSASNHGVWAAIYWWPPHITGGRW